MPAFGFYGILGAGRADGKDELDGSLHVELAVTTSNGHALGVRIERLDRHPRALTLDSLTIDTPARETGDRRTSNRGRIREAAPRLRGPGSGSDYVAGHPSRDLVLIEIASERR